MSVRDRHRQACFDRGDRRRVELVVLLADALRPANPSAGAQLQEQPRLLQRQRHEDARASNDLSASRGSRLTALVGEVLYRDASSGLDS